ncbi:MAG: hypothetical protein ICV59_00915 [Thermoleophilia bacterium]|nr:hypothetical protein [Thermoleophilia bacterium]
MRRAALIVVAAIAAVLLFVGLRPHDDDEHAARTPTGTTQTTTVPRARATTTQPQPPPGPTVIGVSVRRGRVAGGLKRATLERGDRAVLVVRADVSDHVHLHGYDRFADVAPGRPARLRFRATIPGRFEAELEDAGLPILDLEVRP